MQNAVLNETNTYWILEQWARWAKCGNKSVGYPSCTSVSALIGGSVRQSVITDDEAIYVDQIIARLRERDNELGKAVALYALCNENISHVARLMSVDRRKADLFVRSGIAWIDGVLSSAS